MLNVSVFRPLSGPVSYKMKKDKKLLKHSIFNLYDVINVPKYFFNSYIYIYIYIYIYEVHISFQTFLYGHLKLS